MKNGALRVFAAGIVLLLVLALSGCGTDNSSQGPAVEKIFEKCVQKSVSYATVKVNGNIKANLSGGRYATRSFTGAARKINDDNLQGKTVISGRILSGQNENATLYYDNGYVYFNTGDGWWKSPASPPKTFTDFAKYARNIRMLSSDKDSYKIACDISLQYLRDAFRLQPKPNQTRYEKGLNTVVNNSRITAVLTIKKGSFLLTDVVEDTRMTIPNSSGGETLHMSYYTHYYGYNSPADVSLPADALDANNAGNGLLFPWIQGFGQAAGPH